MSSPTPTEPNTPAGDEPTADVLRKLLADARTEAAANRVKGKEKVEAAKAEITAEYEAKLAQATAALEAAKSETASSVVQLSKLQAALDATVPDLKERVVDIAKRLVGQTDEELKADAARVKDLFGVTPTTPVKPKATDPSQGQGNNALPLNGDPLLNMITNVVNKRTR